MMQQVEQLPSLLQYVDEANYGRSCLYLVSTCAYLPPPDDVAVLQQVSNRNAGHHDVHLCQRPDTDVMMHCLPDVSTLR